MKKKIAFALIAISSTLSGYTQVPVIGTIISKVIKAVDLQVQRMQNETIWMQQVQLVLERQLSETKLGEIRDITKDQKQLYENYYAEYLSINNTINSSNQTTLFVENVGLFIKEYTESWKLIKQPSLFSQSELEGINNVYGGMVINCKNSQAKFRKVLTPSGLKMNDAERLNLINECVETSRQYLDDLRQFNRENLQILLQRAKEKHDVVVLKQLNGIK